MKKKIVTLALVAALVAVAVVGATLAYFTDTTDPKTNTFTVGNVDITLTEPAWTSSGALDAPEVYAGEVLAKDPTVTNSGKNPCFVRVQVTGLKTLLVPSPMPEGKTLADYEIKYRTNGTIGNLGANWEDGGDGYFYYKKILYPDIPYYSDITLYPRTSAALFDHVVIPTAITNGDGTTPKNIVVTAEAVQAQGALGLNWAGVQGMDLAQIKTWFATCIPTP